MRTIPAGEFKQICLRLLDEVGASGEPIVVTKRGRPVAQLTALPASSQGDWAGALRDQGTVHGDLVAPATDPSDWSVLSG